MEFENLFTAYCTVFTQHADRILFKNRNMTFAETWQKVEGRARFLRDMGFEKGDVIAVLADTSPEWCITYMAVTAIGAIALPLDTNLTADQYREMLESDARAVFVSAGLRNLVTHPAVYAIEDEYQTTDDSPLEDPGLEKDDIASLLFTSGTTGIPKIVSLTHGNILHVALVCTKMEEYTEDDLTLAMLPLYHVYAFESTFMAPLLTGSAIVFQSSLKGPDIIRTLGENNITIFPAAPQVWELFFDALLTKIRAQSMLKYRVFMFFLQTAPCLKACGLNCLLRKVFSPVHDVFGHHIRFFISGGAPLKKEYFNYYRRMGFSIMEGYGLTETTGPIAIPYYREAQAGAVGPPIPGNEVKIKNVNADGVGEIWLRGEAVMPGYYKNEEANRQAFDDDGFFNTQDLGFIDGKGHIHVTGREKNLIVLASGKNVYPEELELYFCSSPAVAEIAVFGRKVDGRETVSAVIVPTVKGAGSYNAVREAINELNTSLPPYKTLTHFALSADPLPRNSTRKVLIDEVIRLLEQGVYQTDAAGTAIPRAILKPADMGEEEIIDALKQKLRATNLYANETLADYRIDSLGLIELIVYLEDTLGVAISMDNVDSLMTLEKFVGYLAACPRESGAHLDEVILKSPITTKTVIFPNPVSELVLFLVRIISRLFWRLRTVNQERLVPENSIIAANHQSFLDLPWLFGSLPYTQRKRLFITGKKELSFLKYVFAGSPILFVDRQGNVVPSLKAASDILRSGDSLIIFPEGTRTADGTVRAFKSGAAYLAHNLDKKIIPVTIRGAFDVMPRHTIIPRFFSGVRGEIVVGEAIEPRDFPSVDALNDHLHAVISREIQGSA